MLMKYLVIFATVAGAAAASGVSVVLDNLDNLSPISRALFPANNEDAILGSRLLFEEDCSLYMTPQPEGFGNYSVRVSSAS